MAVPFFAEHLANIQSIRATLCSAPDYPVPEKLRIVNQTLTLGSVSVVPFESVGIRVEPTVVGLTHHDTCLWDFKLTTRQSLQTQGDLPAVWSARDLKDTKQIVCRACQQSLAEAPVFQSKDLPSEHWYELVECWICHETKPEEHRARMQPIGARQDMILVGTTYLLLHPDNTKHLQVDETRLRNVNWDQGLQTRWLPVHCQQCGADIGEGQYKRDENGTPALLASKLYKYAVSIPSQTSCPVFMDFLTHDLVSAAKAHATYRFLIQGRKDNKTYALMWLFNWDTNIIYNHGFQDGGSAVHHKRVMKVLYVDCTDASLAALADRHRATWSKDKTAEYLTYPDAYCRQLVDTLKSSTGLLPPPMRRMTHPVMPMLDQFSVGYIER